MILSRVLRGRCVQGGRWREPAPTEGELTRPVLESYYTACLGAGVSPALDLQWVHNPGYNRDRGPVVVISVRLHLEL
jgi:hypothetical protein